MSGRNHVSRFVRKAAPIQFSGGGQFGDAASHAADPQSRARHLLARISRLVRYLSGR
jgi:hypothetical protein